MKTTFIYALRDPRDKAIRYIGKSNNPKVRLAGHRADRVNRRKLAWLAELDKLKMEPTIEILAEVDRGCWQEAERAAIAQHDGLLNVHEGGRGGNGRRPRGPMKPRSFRATDDEWKLYSEAAQASGIGDCSQWMRFILNREARMQLGGK